MYEAGTAKPRKSPQQRRSKDTVKAIREATLQLLLKTDEVPFTTNGVAVRAGVSIGTLYQYFSDKAGLFQELFRHSFVTITEAVESTCAENVGRDPETMAKVLIDAFMGTALKDLPVAQAQHAVVDLAILREIVPPLRERQERAIASMVNSLGGLDRRASQEIAQVIFANLAGNTRSLLDRRARSAEVRRAMQEIETMTATYLRESTFRRVPLASTPRSVC